jgi:hypothetical protein
MVMDLPSQDTYYRCFTNSPLKELTHRHDKTTFDMCFLSLSFQEMHSQQITKLTRECLQKNLQLHFYMFYQQ